MRVLSDFAKIHVIKRIEFEMGWKSGLNERVKRLFPIFAYLCDFDVVGGIGRGFELVVHGQVSFCCVLNFDDEAFGGIGKLDLSHVRQFVVQVLHDQDAVIFSFINPMSGCEAIFDMGTESGGKPKVEHISHNYKHIFINSINQSLISPHIFDAVKKQVIFNQRNESWIINKVN